MPFIDDLTKATNLFNSGMQKLTLQRSLSKANEAIEQINQSELQDAEKKEQLKALGQQLTLNLTGAGIPASTIQTLNESLGTQAEKDRLYQTAEQKALAFPKGTPERAAADAMIKQKHTRALEILDDKQAHAIKLENIKTGARVAKEKKKFTHQQSTIYDKLQDRFVDKMVKDELTSISGATKIKAVIGSGKSKATIGMAIRMLIRQSGDPRPSDKDVEGVTPNSSIAMQVKRAWHEWFLNERLPEDADVIIAMGKSLVAATKRTMKAKTIRYSTGKRDRLKESGRTPLMFAEDMHEMLLGGPASQLLGEELEQLFKDAEQDNLMGPRVKGASKRPGARVLFSTVPPK